MKEYREMLRDHKMKKQSSASDDPINKKGKKVKEKKDYIVEYILRLSVWENIRRWDKSIKREWAIWRKYTNEEDAKKAIRQMEHHRFYEFRYGRHD